MTEEVRLGTVKVGRRCACRGWVIGFNAPSANNSLAVEQHQQTRLHQEWDREAWVERNTADKDVKVITVIKKVA